MTKLTSNQSARKSGNRISPLGCFGILMLCFVLWFVCPSVPMLGYFFALGEESLIEIPSYYLPPAPSSLPVVAISSENMSRVVEIKRLSTNHPVRWLSAWSSDSRVLATVDQGGGTIDLWDVSEGRNTGSISVDAYVRGIVFSPDGKLLAVSRYDEVRLYDVATGNKIQTFGGKNIINRVVNLAFSPDGTRLAGGMQVGNAILLDIPSGKELRMFSDPHPMCCASTDSRPAFSPDGKILALGDFSGVTVWDVETGITV